MEAGPGIGGLLAVTGASNPPRPRLSDTRAAPHRMSAAGSLGIIALLASMSAVASLVGCGRQADRSDATMNTPELISEDAVREIARRDAEYQQ